MHAALIARQPEFSSHARTCLPRSQSLVWLALVLISLPPPLLLSVTLSPPSLHSPPLPPFNLHSLPCLSGKTNSSITKQTSALINSSCPFLVHPACSHRRPLLRPGYKPALGGFPAGFGSDGVHWEQGEADLGVLLRVQWTKCGLPGHQDWAAKKGEEPIFTVPIHWMICLLFFFFFAVTVSTKKAMQITGSYLPEMCRIGKLKPFKPKPFIPAVMPTCGKTEEVHPWIDLFNTTQW